jgi:hypothetical protein
MIPAVRYSKNADSAVLREKPIIPPRNASAIGRTLPRIYKKILSRDTKLAILRELRKGNPCSESSGRGRRIRRPFYSKPDNRRTSPKRESGQAISDLDFFAMSYGLDFHSGKTVDQPIPSRKSKDSPRTASTGETPQKKRGPQFFSRDARVLLWMAACYSLALANGFNPRVLSLIIRRLSRRSSIRRLDEMRLAPIDRRTRCETSTALSMVPIFSASSTLDIGVTSKVNPGTSDIALTTALTYRPTLVPAPMGWMLNSAIRTIRLLALGCTDNRSATEESLVFTS